MEDVKVAEVGTYQETGSGVINGRAYTIRGSKVIKIVKYKGRLCELIDEYKARGFRGDKAFVMANGKLREEASKNIQKTAKAQDCDPTSPPTPTPEAMRKALIEWYTQRYINEGCTPVDAEKLAVELLDSQLTPVKPLFTSKDLSNAKFGRTKPTVKGWGDRSSKRDTLSLEDKIKAARKAYLSILDDLANSFRDSETDGAHARVKAQRAILNEKDN